MTRIYLGNTRVTVTVPPQVNQIIYGIKLDTQENNSSPYSNSWGTYTDDAVGLQGAYMDFTNNTFVDNGWLNRWPFNEIKPCLVKNGAVVGYLNPNDYTKFADGTSAPTNDPTEGNVMVEFPKIYYKISADSRYNYIQISNATFTGACCLAHVYKGQELSKIYVDAYLTGDANYTTNGLHSVKGVTLSHTQSKYTSMYDALRASRESRCEPMSYNFFNLIGCLYAIMFGNTYCIGSLGTGLSAATTSFVTGALDTNGMYYGYNQNTYRVKLFGLEDYYGGKKVYVSGFYARETNTFRFINPYDSTQGYSYNDIDDYDSLIVSDNDWTAGSSTTAIKIKGDNRLGFLHLNLNIAGNTTNSAGRGFCGRTNYQTNSLYGLMRMSDDYGTKTSVYNCVSEIMNSNQYDRVFRCIYYPNN